MRVVATVTGLKEAMAYIAQVEDRLQNDRHKGLFKAVNRIGDVWLDNYETEGGRVGGWPDLAEYTVARREEDGFPGTNPILKRSGALKGVMVESLTRVSSSGSISRNDTYSPQTTRSSIAVKDGVAVIDAHGWKVANQYRVGGRFGHPARPIWFVDKTVSFAARSGIIDWLANDVVRS